MTSTAITAKAVSADNIALAGKALEKIGALAASMGGELSCIEPSSRNLAKIEVYDHAVYINTVIKLPVSALSEYIAQSGRQAGGTP